MQTDRRKVKSIIAKHFNTTPEDIVVIRCAEEICTGKIGDAMDGTLAFLVGPEAMQEKKILDDLERGLGVYFKRDDDAVKNSRNIRLDMVKNPGRTVEKWLAWCRSDEWRLGHLNIYRDTYKIWGEWPQQDEYKPSIQKTFAGRLPPMMD